MSRRLESRWIVHLGAPGMAAGEPEPSALNRSWLGICAVVRRLSWFLVGPLGAILLGLPLVSQAGPVVSNVQVRQRPRPAEFEVTYDLTHSTWPSLGVSFLVSLDAGQTFRVLTNGISGDFGPQVPASKARRIVWRGPLGWLGDDRRELRFKLVAREPEIPPGMIRIRSGKFQMGNPEARIGNTANEGPVTEVTFTQGFWMGRYEVTQREWEAVMQYNPSQFTDSPDLPAENVSWEEAAEYCRRVTTREREAGQLPSGHVYRLPTEAEWEYACRAGTTTATAFGDQVGSLQANFNGKFPHNGAPVGPNLGRTTRVGSYPANPWGLHDMHGNVLEWCLDFYRERLPGQAVSDPSGPLTGYSHVVRGGGWNNHGKYCRSAYRNGCIPSLRVNNLGFRVVCGPALP